MKFSSLACSTLGLFSFALAQEAETVITTMEDLQQQILELKAQNYDLLVQLNSSMTTEEAEMLTMNTMIEELARQDWGALPQARFFSFFLLFHKEHCLQ